VIELKMPPLRHRQADIPLLAEYILQRVAAKNQQKKPRLTRKALTMLQQYPFPGNVRELENTLERAMTWTEGDAIEADDLMLPETAAAIVSSAAAYADMQNAEVGSPNDLETHLESQERAIIQQALEDTRWNRTAAAKKLGISFRALRYKLKKLDID
jgi:two-component system response regulator PilR (NtrC family)